MHSQTPAEPQTRVAVAAHALHHNCWSSGTLLASSLVPMPAIMYGTNYSTSTLLKLTTLGLRAIFPPPVHLGVVCLSQTLAPAPGTLLWSLVKVHTEDAVSCITHGTVATSLPCSAYAHAHPCFPRPRPCPAQLLSWVSTTSEPAPHQKSRKASVEQQVLFVDVVRFLHEPCGLGSHSVSPFRYHS
jgi:hypothetical protein